MLSNLFSVTIDLGGRGDQWQKLRELRTKLIDSELIDLEEEVGLGLFGKTHPINGESKHFAGKVP